MVNIGLGTAAAAALMGYGVVFLGILILMAVISLMGALMKKSEAKASASSAEVIDLGNITAPKGADLRQVAAMAAVIAELEREE